MEPRAICWRCRRPEAVCYCALIPRVESRTRVVFLQHARERKVAVSTCRMAHLALANSEMHVGVRFEGAPRLAEVCAASDTAVLFPGEGARDLAELPAGFPKTLVVVDGTWVNAKKLLARNPSLAALPRIGFTPSRPGNYRIRKEPAEHCVSTIEAVVEVLSRLEQDPHRFHRMLVAFDRMVDTQLDFIHERKGPSRYKVRRTRQPRLSLLRELAEARDRLVVVYAESNAFPSDAGMPGIGELLHLVAERVATNERFEALLAPRRPLAPNAHIHLELSAETILAGEPVAPVLARFQAFLRPDDLLCGWGRFPFDVLAAEEGGARRPHLDLKRAAAQALRRRAGGVDQALTLLRQPVPAGWTCGRAGRRVAGIAALARALADAQRPTRPPGHVAEPRPLSTG